MKKIFSFFLFFISFEILSQTVSISYNITPYYSPYFNSYIGISNIIQAKYEQKSKLNIGSYIGQSFFSYKSLKLKTDLLSKASQYRAGLIATIPIYEKENNYFYLSLGLGIIYQSRNYLESAIDKNQQVFYREKTRTFTEAEVPLSLEYNYKINEKYKLGMQLNTFLKPGFPLLGISLGPKISIDFK